MKANLIQFKGADIVVDSTHKMMAIIIESESDAYEFARAFGVEDGFYRAMCQAAAQTFPVDSELDLLR